MDNPPSIIPVTDITLDKETYPRSAIDHRRVSLFAENLRDGFTFDPIHVEAHPEEKGKYRILDGAHRWHAHREAGIKAITANIIRLDGLDPNVFLPFRPLPHIVGFFRLTNKLPFATHWLPESDFLSLSLSA